jgi:hypothetical protein
LELIVHLIYYDEVKYDPPKQPSYWLGGICVSDDIVADLERQVSDIANRAFGSPLLSKETEIHGVELCRGNGAFKGRDFGERLGFLKDLLAVIAREDVSRIRVKVNPEKITHSAKPPAGIAFMFSVEKANELLSEKDTRGMLFGDYDEPAIGTSVATLSQFREGGTQWARSKPIDRLIDTVHFAKSHHSRMIQLADIYLYCQQFAWGDNQSSWRKAVNEVIQASGVLAATKWKDWPSEAVWYR